MNLVICGAENKTTNIQQNRSGVNWMLCKNINEAKQVKDADAFFFLDEDAFLHDYSFTHKPVFINSVVYTLQERNHTAQVIRFNGWNGWLSKNKWELSGQLSAEALAVLNHLSITPILLPDEVGFISNVVIALIINEAFYAEAAKVSSRSEIDLAMKLGTGYPYGPFEWANLIGVKEVYELLLKLSATHQKYIPAPTLLPETKK